MARRVHSHKELLRVLQKASPKLRKAILKEIDQPALHTICEICHNVINGAVPLSRAAKTKLARHKTVLRRLAQRGEGWPQKKKYLALKGASVLPALLSTVLSGLSG